MPFTLFSELSDLIMDAEKSAQEKATTPTLEKTTVEKETDEDGDEDEEETVTSTTPSTDAVRRCPTLRSPRAPLSSPLIIPLSRAFPVPAHLPSTSLCPTIIF